MIQLQPSYTPSAILRSESNPSLQPADPEAPPAIQKTLERPLPRLPNTQPFLFRLSRQSHENEVTPTPGNVTVRKFADALVDSGDRQLALDVANNLVRHQLYAHTGRVRTGEYPVIVPPLDSTFGQAWTELRDAVNSEPFKSFAEARKLDTSHLSFFIDGRLSGTANNRRVNYYLHQDPEWAAASTAVLAAAKKVGGENPMPVFIRDGGPSVLNVANFYGLQLDRLDYDHVLPIIKQLFQDGTFKALSSSDPLHASVKQRQKEASQRIVDLPADQLSQRLAQFAPSAMAQQVKEADRTLAQQVSQALLNLLPDAQGQSVALPVMLKDIPQYSTFNQVRKNLLDALAGNAFTTFAQGNNVDRTSVRINPITGDMTGKVNGVDRDFSANDLSGWSDAWNEIKGAVQQMAAGSDAFVQYPAPPSASLYEVMAFYNEPVPAQPEPQQSDWQQRQRVSALERSVALVTNNGFKALVNPGVDDARSAAVQERQNAVTQQLVGAPAPRSTLESLAAAVVASQNVNNVEPSDDELVSNESELAASVHRAMLELTTGVSLAPSKMIEPIPDKSLFGQWWSQLGKALKGRGLTDWARQHNVELATLHFDPLDKALIGKVNGVNQRFTAADFAQKYPEHFDALTAVADAAQALVPNGRPLMLSHGSDRRAPYELVSNFYGIENNDYSSLSFANTTAQMGRTQSFPEQPENPLQSLDRLRQQKTALGNSNDRYMLIQQLKHGHIDNNDTTHFLVDPDSSHRPKGPATVRKYLADQNWYAPTSADEKANLLKALQTPVPQSPDLGDRWGFLSKGIPLSAEQRSAVDKVVRESIGTHNNLLSFLSSGVNHLSTDPDQALDQLLSSTKAIELANNLQTEMKGAATPTSLKEWLLTAVVMEIDSTAGTQHKTVAGIDLMGAAYSGHSAEFIRDQFSHDLAAKKAIPANLKPVIAQLMMSGMAPQLLVKEVPNVVTLGSPEWVNFTTAVNRIEWNAPGATRNMTYQQVMNYHNIKPISALEAQILSYAQMNPLLDWAALNNDVNKDDYTLEQLKESQVKLQAQMKATAGATNWLSQFDAPNRRALTHAVLRKEFGDDIDYERRYMVENEAFGVISGGHYSLAEIYEAGRLGERWLQEGNNVDFDRLRKRANEPDFPVINDQFDEAIKQDFNLRRRHTVTLFENMLRKLPVEEHKSLLYGDVQFTNVEGAGSGLVITSLYKGVRRDFAVYPAQGQIVRIADIDPSTPLGRPVSLEIDAEAFKNGTAPKKGVKSEVVLSTADQRLLDDNNEPWPVAVNFPAHSEHDKFSPHYANGRLSKLAKVMVDSTYLNKTQFINLHRNWASNSLETATQPSDFFKAIWHALPGANSIEDLYHGQFLKAGFDLAVDVAIYAATEGAGKLWTLAKSGASWAAAKISAGFIEKFGTKEAESIALTEMTTLSTSESLSATGRLQGSHLGVPASNQVLQASGIADRTVLRPDTGERILITTVSKDGERYAYNPTTLEAEGPSLEWVVPEGSDRIGRIRLGGPLEAVMPLDGEIQTFVDTYDGKPRLNIMGHAPEPDTAGAPIKIVGDNQARYSAAEINQKLLDRGVDIRNFDNVRTVVCFSASGGERSFAAELQKITGKPVKGFEGPVITEWRQQDLKEKFDVILRGLKKQFPREREENILELAEIKFNKAYKPADNHFTLRKDVGNLVEVNIGTVKTPVYMTVPVDYRAVRFGPQKNITTA
ncbi:hypothetical protein [Pseudomonas sp. Z13]|uniref:hypothetical protein n=1 Tax=Pseudomonas sp. Z13 TaxID=2983409 RepID=UPI002E80C8FC|nr:hypothetical protein [Pseudomonas sp. Z13]